MTKVTHLLVVDDDTRIRELLSTYLVEQGYFVSTAADAEEARAQMAEFIFDLVVMDVMMPGESGLELTQQVRKTSQVPILMLTAMGEVEDRITGLESGVDDYLTKPFDPRELALRIDRILHRSKEDEAPSVRHLRLGNRVFDITRLCFTDGKGERLNAAEGAIIHLLAKQLNKPVSREALAKACGGIERSVDVQVKRLREKIEPDPKKPSFIQTVRGEGYVLYGGYEGE